MLPNSSFCQGRFTEGRRAQPVRHAFCQYLAGGDSAHVLLATSSARYHKIGVFEQLEGLTNRFLELGHVLSSPWFGHGHPHENLHEVDARMSPGWALPVGTEDRHDLGRKIRARQ